MPRLRTFFESIGGARPLPEWLARRWYTPVLLGAWWALLILLVFAFAGHTAKFVYVDF